MTYPDDPGHTKGVDTSREAAKAISADAHDQCSLIYRNLVTARNTGFTLDEMFKLVEGSIPGLIKNNLSARLGQLCARGLAISSDSVRRKQPGRARAQSVYYAIGFAPEGGG